MNTCTYYQANGQPGQPVPFDQIRGGLHDAGLLWLDIIDPTESDIAKLAADFSFHPVALDDLKEHKHRPKVAEYKDHIFMIAHELHPVAGERELNQRCVEISTELRIFVGANYFVTVHEGESESIKTTRERWESNGDLQRKGPYFLLYLLIDSLVDDYFPAMDAYDDRIDILEHLVLQPADEEVSMMTRDTVKGDAQKPLRTLLSLRRELLEIRRSVGPLRDGINVLLRRVESLQGDRNDDADRGKEQNARALFTYFQDVYDHTIRIVDTIDTYRDLLAGTLDAHLAVASNRLNEIVKVLTSVSIILMTWGIITGIYGMNFVNMPELHWRLGYPYAIGLLIISGILEWIYFRRKKWL